MELFPELPIWGYVHISVALCGVFTSHSVDRYGKLRARKLLGVSKSCNGLASSFVQLSVDSGSPQGGLVD